MSVFYKYIKPYLALFILSPSLMLIEVYCEVKIPYLAGEILNKGVIENDTTGIFIMFLQMFLYICLAIAGGVGACYVASKAAVNFSCDLQVDVFEKIQKFSFANIDKFSTGSLVTRLTNDITQLQELVILSLRMLFRAPGMLIGALVMTFTINAELATIFFVLVPLLAIIVSVSIKLSYKKFGLLQTKVDDMNLTVGEALTNVRVIKSLAREEREIDKFKDVNSELKNTGLSAFRLMIAQMPIMTLIINIAIVAIVWFGGLGILEGTMQVGDITAFITYTTQILMSVAMLAMVFIQASRAIASGERVAEVLETEIDLTDDNAKNVDLKVSKGDITFKNVDFKYYKNNDETVLTNIDLNISGGQTVGIIGSTGCGKTSLVQLILRLYDADCGEVFVDGVDVKDYSLKNLRTGISIVPQNNVLFSGTIYENLLWGDKEASEEDIKNCCEWSATNEFIEKLPSKFETVLGQGGVNLSGGQKQRLNIARALLKNSDIYIFDEVTSNIDPKSEDDIMQVIKDLSKTKIIIVISHRLSNIIEANKIIVLENGSISDIGTHSELISKECYYKKMFTEQQELESYRVIK